MLYIALGCIFYTFIYAAIFTRWANISTFKSGFKAGVILGGLHALSMHFFFLTGDFNFMFFIKDLIINIIMTAFMAGVVGYVCGKIKT